MRHIICIIFTVCAALMPYSGGEYALELFSAPSSAISISGAASAEPGVLALMHDNPGSLGLLNTAYAVDTSMVTAMGPLTGCVSAAARTPIGVVAASVAGIGYSDVIEKSDGVNAGSVAASALYAFGMSNSTAGFGIGIQGSFAYDFFDDTAVSGAALSGGVIGILTLARIDISISGALRNVGSAQFGDASLPVRSSVITGARASVFFNNTKTYFLSLACDGIFSVDNGFRIISEFGARDFLTFGLVLQRFGQDDIGFGGSLGISALSVAKIPVRLVIAASMYGLLPTAGLTLSFAWN